MTPPPLQDHELSAWARLGRFSFRRRWFVLGAWLVTVVSILALVGSIGASSSSSTEIPESESQSGFDTLTTYFGGLGSGMSGSIVFRAEQGVDDPAVEAAMTAMIEQVATIPEVTRLRRDQPGATPKLIEPDRPRIASIGSRTSSMYPRA